MRKNDKKKRRCERGERVREKEIEKMDRETEKERERERGGI